MRDNSLNGKKLRSTMDGNRSRSRSPVKKADFTMELSNLRGHIEKSNKEISQLKTEIEFSKRATGG